MTYLNNINYFKILQNNTTGRVIVLIGELHTRDDCSNIGFNTPYGIGDLLTDIARALPRLHTPHIYIECPKIDPAALTTPSVMFDICNMNQFQLNYLTHYTVDNGIDDRHELPELVELYRIAIQPYFSGSTPDPRNLTRIINILRTFKTKYYTFLTIKYNKTMTELMLCSPSIRRIIEDVEKIYFKNLSETVERYRNREINQIDTLQNIHRDLYPIILSGLDISIALKLMQHSDFTILYTGSDHCQTMSKYFFYNTNNWYTLYEGTIVGTNCIIIDTEYVLDIMRSISVQMRMGFGYRKKNKSHTRYSLGSRSTSLRGRPFGSTALAYVPLRVAAPKVKRSPSPVRSQVGRRSTSLRRSTRRAGR
jgi:hypothetical protein